VSETGVQCIKAMKPLGREKKGTEGEIEIENGNGKGKGGKEHLPLLMAEQ